MGDSAPQRESQEKGLPFKLLTPNAEDQYLGVALADAVILFLDRGDVARDLLSVGVARLQDGTSNRVASNVAIPYWHRARRRCSRSDAVRTSPRPLPD